MNLKEVYNSIIKEASLSRIWQLVENDKYSFAIVSAYRRDFDPKENASRHFQLKSDIINGKKYGFIELRGGYVETSKDGEKVPVTEESMLINGIKKEDAIKLGNKYQQEAVLFKDANGFELLDSSGGVIASFKKSSGRDNITLAKAALEQFFSSLKKGSHAGKKFAFVQEHEEWNWIKAMGGRERKWYTILLNESTEE